MKAGREWVCDKVKKDDNWIMIQKMNSVSRKYFFSLKRDINKFCEMCLMLLGWVLHIYMCLSCWKWGEGEIFLFYSGIPVLSCFIFPLNWFSVENRLMINVVKKKIKKSCCVNFNRINSLHWPFLPWSDLKITLKALFGLLQCNEFQFGRFYVLNWFVLTWNFAFHLEYLPN